MGSCIIFLCCGFGVCGGFGGGGCGGGGGGGETAVAECLKCCATNRKFAGSIRDGVIGNFH